MNTTERKLQRNIEAKSIAGVCAGLADYFDADVTLVRAAFVIAVLAGFSGVLLYIILWIVMPRRVSPMPGYVYPAGSMASDPLLDIKRREKAERRKRRNSKAGLIIGVAFIVFGFSYLLDEFNLLPYWFEIGKLWPLALIIPGVLMISRARKKEMEPAAPADSDLEQAGTDAEINDQPQDPKI